MTDTATEPPAVEDEKETTAALNAAADQLDADLANDHGDDDPDAPEGKIFDDEKYESDELRIPKIDGEGVDKLVAKFGGRTFLDRSDPRDCALIRDCRMGQKVTLMVEAIVGPPVPGYTTNRDGDLDSLVLGRTFVIEKVWRATPESVDEQLKVKTYEEG